MKDFIRKRNERKDEAAYLGCFCRVDMDFSWEPCEECKKYANGNNRKSHTLLRALTPDSLEIFLIGVFLPPVVGAVIIFFIIAGAVK